MTNTEATLKAMLAPVVEALGYEFVGCEFISYGRGKKLRVFIDTPNGVTVDDCEKASRQMSAVLDVEDPIRSDYHLEVSSPGLDRPLFELAHYKRFVGCRVKLRLKVPQGDRRNFTGEIKAVEGESIVLVDNKDQYQFAFNDIDRARIIPELS